MTFRFAASPLQGYTFSENRTEQATAPYAANTLTGPKSAIGPLGYRSKRAGYDRPAL
ncbi:MAG: hypothetical protein JWO59_2550 [Chloroflexi bacterium]|nr:hypothetical protein [Chloroflexota bacterium]